MYSNLGLSFRESVPLILKIFKLYIFGHTSSWKSCGIFVFKCIVSRDCSISLLIWGWRGGAEGAVWQDQPTIFSTKPILLGKHMQINAPWGCFFADIPIISKIYGQSVLVCTIVCKKTAMTVFKKKLHIDPYEYLSSFRRKKSVFGF